MVLWNYLKGGQVATIADSGTSLEEEVGEDIPECKHHAALVEECSRGFILAEQLEAGRAREAPFGLLAPLKRNIRLRRFYIMRSENRFEFSLYREDTNSFVMHARWIPDEGRADMLLHHPKDKRYDPTRPCFSLYHSSDNKNWVAYAEQCQSCHYKPGRDSCRAEGGQEILRVAHDQVPIGEGLFNTMSIAIPGLDEDGRPTVWCPRVGCPPPGDDMDSLAKSNEVDVLLLASKRPEWHKKMRSLVLDFKDRSVVPSAKNFQIVMAGKKANHVLCQYGKVGMDKFILDLRGPLSLVQAFALTLTTMFWK
jgi:hypothetical protein